MEEKYIQKMLPFYHLIKAYHRHDLKNPDSIPQKGPVMVLLNHSFATYDVILLGGAIYLQTGRMPYALGDSNLFTLPFVKNLTPKINIVEAGHANGERLLNDGELVCIAPGGMREALRPSHERYQIVWKKRRGFAKLAVKTGAQVILAACPKADEIFDIYPSFLTRLAYKKLKLPFVLAKGLGPTFIPKPVKLVHYLSKPLVPPKKNPGQDDFEQRVEAFHTQVVQEMERLMKS